MYNVERTVNTLLTYNFEPNNRDRNPHLLCVKVDREGVFLDMISSGEVTLWNRILSIFGLGPLANAYLGINDITLHLKMTLNATGNPDLVTKVKRIILEREQARNQTQDDSQLKISETMTHIFNRAYQKGNRSIDKNFINNLFVVPVGPKPLDSRQQPSNPKADFSSAQLPSTKVSPPSKQEPIQQFPAISFQKHEEYISAYNKKFAQVKEILKNFEPNQIKDGLDLNKVAQACEECFTLYFEINDLLNQIDLNLIRSTNSKTLPERLRIQSQITVGKPNLDLKFAKLLTQVYKDSSYPPNLLLNLDEKLHLHIRPVKQFWESLLKAQNRATVNSQQAI